MSLNHATFSMIFLTFWAVNFFCSDLNLFFFFWKQLRNKNKSSFRTLARGKEKKNPYSIFISRNIKVVHATYHTHYSINLSKTFISRTKRFVFKLLVDQNTFQKTLVRHFFVVLFNLSSSGKRGNILSTPKKYLSKRCHVTKEARL